MALVCYHGENPHIINQERADIILGAIADPSRRKIIVCVKDEFKTAQQISRETSLPITTIYRKYMNLMKKMYSSQRGKSIFMVRKRFPIKARFGK